MKKIFLIIAAAVSIAAMSCTDNRSAYPKKTGVTRIVSYNVGVFGKYMENSGSMISGMMKEIGADVMVLNELDRNNGRHDCDQIAEFAGYMGWKHVFSPAMPYKGGEYGNGIVYGNGKAEKIIDSFSIPLKKKSGSEDRVCVVVEFEDFVLAGTHLDVGSEEDRISGAKTITTELRARYGSSPDKPVFLCGDMNARPESGVIKTFEQDWDHVSPLDNTHSSHQPNKCIDYIFALKGAGKYTVVSSGVCTQFKSGDVKKASDHLPVYADIKFE